MDSIVQMLEETFSSTRMEIETAENAGAQARKAVRKSEHTRLNAEETRATATGLIECSRRLRQLVKIGRETHTQAFGKT